MRVHSFVHQRCLISFSRKVLLQSITLSGWECRHNRGHSSYVLMRSLGSTPTDLDHVCGTRHVENFLRDSGHPCAIRRRSCLKSNCHRSSCICSASSSWCQWVFSLGFGDSVVSTFKNDRCLRLRSVLFYDFFCFRRDSGVEASQATFPLDPFRWRSATRHHRKDSGNHQQAEYELFDFFLLLNFIVSHSFCSSSFSF